MHSAIIWTTIARTSIFRKIQREQINFWRQSRNILKFKYIYIYIYCQLHLGTCALVVLHKQ
jgi:hypothetical protein